MCKVQLLGQLVRWSAVIAGVALTSGCGKSSHGSHDSQPAGSLPAIEVRVQTAEAKSRLANEEVVGTVRARVRATVAAKLSGRIEEMPVVLGQAVKAGQLVARLDAAEIKARLEQAQATVQQAERDWNRARALLEQQAFTRAEAESAESRWQVAKAAVAEAQAALRNAEVLAPFDGVVTRKLADAGDLAQPGKPLVELENPADLELEAAVPEAIFNRLQAGAAVTVRAGNAEHRGKVREIAPGSDAVSRTSIVKVELPDAAGLRPGQFARLLVPVGETTSLRVPSEAVLQRGQLELAFVVENNAAALHLVKTGQRVGAEIEVLSGLASGDKVVVEGVARLQDGQPVTVK